MDALVEILNRWGQCFVEISMGMLVQVSVLILLLTVIHWALRKHVRAVIRYWIWTLILVKLVLPPNLISPLGLGWCVPDVKSWVGHSAPAEVEPVPSTPSPRPLARHEEMAEIDSPSTLPSTIVLDHPAMPMATPEQERVYTEPHVVTLTWQGFCFLLWSAGVMGLLLLLIQRALFVNGLVAQALPCSESLQALLNDCRRRLGLSRPVHLRVTPISGSPAVCGLWHPVILIPRDLVEDLSERDLRAVLLHECAHVVRGDLWVNLIQTLLQIVYFYHPLVWWASVQIRRLRERAVDEAVLVALKESASDYPESLVGIARLALSRPLLSLRLIGVVENRSELNGRIRHMLNKPFPKTARLGLTGMLILLVLALLLPMATGSSTVLDMTNSQATKALADLGVDPNNYQEVRLKYWWEMVDFDSGRKIDASSGWIEGADINIVAELKEGRRVEDFVAVQVGHGENDSKCVCRILALESEGILDALVEAHQRREELLASRAVMNRFDTRKSSRWFVVQTDGIKINESIPEGRPQLAIVKIQDYGDKDVQLRYWLADLDGVVPPKEATPTPEKAFVVTGKITDQAGQPLEGVNVRANCGIGTLRLTGQATTDETGQYTLAFGPGMRFLDEAMGQWGAGFQVATIYAFKPGYYEVSLCAQGGLRMADSESQVPKSQQENLAKVVFPRQPYRLNFVMAPAATLHGMVIDPNGKPDANQKFWITGDRLYPSTSVLKSITTDEQGCFVVSDVPLRTFRLVCKDTRQRDVEKSFYLSQAGSWYMKVLHNSDPGRSFFLRILALDRDEGILNQVQDWQEEVSHPPLSEAEQEQCRKILTQVRKVNQYWLIQPSLSIQNFAYSFSLTDHEPVCVNVDNPHQENYSQRQGVSYYSALHRLMNLAEKVTFTSFKQEDNQIVMDFVLPMSMKMYAGNGISGTWRGYFSSRVETGTLWLDPSRYVPVRLETRACTEYYSDYTEIDEGCFVPLNIRIQRSEDMQFDWRFKIHVPELTGGLWLLDEARYRNAAQEQFDLVALVHRVEIIPTQVMQRGRFVESSKVWAWQRTDVYIAPDPNRFFPDDEEAGKALDQLFDEIDKDRRSNDEILSTVRQGFRRTSKHKSSILRWIGNKYIWGKDPQNAEAIEIMYHAVPLERHYAVYFGLSVLKQKTPNVLRTLADICMQGQDVGRITWGIREQKDELVSIIQSYAESQNAQQQEMAQALLRHFDGEQDFDQWRKAQDLQRKQRLYSERLPSLREQLLNGDSQTRHRVLDEINRQGLSDLLDESFLPALIACGRDEDETVRKSITTLVGGRWIWDANPQSPEAINLMMQLAKDQVRDIRYNAVYYGLSTVRNKSEAVINQLVDMALADQENNLYSRILWGLREARSDWIEKALLRRMPRESDTVQEQGAYYLLYRQLLKKDPPESFNWDPVKRAYPETLWMIEYVAEGVNGTAGVWDQLQAALAQDLWLKQISQGHRPNTALLAVHSEEDAQIIVNHLKTQERVKVGPIQPISGTTLLYFERMGRSVRSKESTRANTETILQTLIDEAKPGQIVSVPVGTINAPIHIDKSLVLRGAESGRCILEVTADEPALWIDTGGQGEVTVENLTIKWQLATRDQGIGHPYALGVKDSKALIKGCRFIPLGNFQRSPVGLRVDGFSNVTVEDCRFLGFEYVICYGPGTEGVVQDSIITDCGHQGVINYRNAVLTVQRNIISRSGFHGVRCTGGTLTVRDCLIADVGRCGVYLGNKNGEGTIFNCLFLNDFTGVAGYYGARFDINHNLFIGGSQSGVGAWDTCQLTLENNVFRDNKAGVVVYEKDGENRNILLSNTFWHNEEDANNMALSGQCLQQDPGFANEDQGDYALTAGPTQRAGHGLMDAEVIQLLWQQYDRMNGKEK